MESQQHSQAKNLHALLDLPAAMELRQIELIYRAEGNANLVLALPQFKKVLRLPKMISNRLRQEKAALERKGACQPEGQCESSVGAVTKKGLYVGTAAVRITVIGMLHYQCKISGMRN